MCPGRCMLVPTSKLSLQLLYQFAFAVVESIMIIWSWHISRLDFAHVYIYIKKHANEEGSLQYLLMATPPQYHVYEEDNDVYNVMLNQVSLFLFIQ